MMEEEQTLYGLVEAVCKKHGDKPAVLYDNGELQSGLSYRQLWEISCQVEKVFCSRENEVIGLCLQIDHRMPAILLGILGSNAAFYNLDVKGFMYAKQVLEDLGAQVILIHQRFIKAVQDSLEASGVISTPLGIPGLEDYMVVNIASIARKKHLDCLAYCITTSGTTGKPKVVMVPNQCIVPNIIHLRKLFSLTSADLVLAATALTFDPSIVEIFMALSVGACLLVVPSAVKMMPDLLLDMIYERNKVTVIQITPTLLSRFNACRLSQTILGDNSVMRVIALGGEKFPSCTWLHSMISPNNRTHFYNLYGTTEVSCWATCHHVTEEDLRKGSEIPLGEPLQDTDVKVCDDSGNIVTEGEGRLWIGGRRRQCMLGVTEELQFDRLVLRDTGDIVHMSEGGKLYYIGRRDQQKKRNGRRIDLDEIKMVGQRNKYVHDCEVMLVHDLLVVFIVLSQQTVVTDVGAIDLYMKERLPPHWWPDSVILISTLPVTVHGKVDFKSLEQTYKERQTGPCNSDIAGYLTYKWKELLPGCKSTHLLENVNIPETQNFILAGGDSLKAVKLANVIENHLGIQLQLLIDIILHKTYSEVRQYLTTALDNSAKQCNNDSKAVLSVISDKTSDQGIVSNINTNPGKSGSASESPHGVKIPVQKRKISEDRMINKVTKYSNDFQFSVSRCNRLVTTVNYRNKNVQRMVKSLEKEHDVKTCCTEVNDDSKTKGNCNLSIEEVWKYNTRKCVDASPLLAVKSSGEFVVMIGSHSHRFIAISGSTGAKQWEITLPDRIESSACLSACGNYVIVGCYNGKVYSLHVDNGEIWWQFRTGSQVKCSPVVDVQTGLAYIGSHSQIVYCLNVSDREVVWQRSLECGSIFSSPAITSDAHQLYIATLGGEMFALNPANGMLIWEYNFQKPMFSSPAVTELGVLVGCTDKCLYHLSNNGELLWKFSTGGHIFSSPSVFRWNVSALGTVHSQSRRSDPATTVTSDCKRETDNVKDGVKDSNRGPNMHRPLETIVVGSHDKCVYCISSIGELVWRLQADSEVYSSPFQCYLNVNNPDIEHDFKENTKENEPEKTKRGTNPTEVGNFLSESVSDDGSYHTVSEKEHEKITETDITETNIKCQCSNCRAISQVSSTQCTFDIEDKHNKDDTLHVVLFASTVGTLYIVHVPTGKVLCTKHLDGEIFSSPVVYKNTVVVGCRNDLVYCFKIS